MYVNIKKHKGNKPEKQTTRELGPFLEKKKKISRGVLTRIQTQEPYKTYYFIILHPCQLCISLMNQLSKLDAPFCKGVKHVYGTQWYKHWTVIPYLI